MLRPPPSHALGSSPPGSDHTAAIKKALQDGDGSGIDDVVDIALDIDAWPSRAARQRSRAANRSMSLLVPETMIRSWFVTIVFASA